MSPNIDSKLVRQLEGRCCYGACVEPAGDGDYCLVHDAHERGRDAGKKRRARQALADTGQCVMNCGRKVGKRMQNGRAQQRRCPDCAKVLREQARERRSVPDESRSVPVASADLAPRTKLEVHKDGYTRVRTTGRGLRGQRPREELDDEIRSDLSDVIRQVQDVRDDGIARLRSPAVQELGRAQRKEAAAVVADRLLWMARVLESAADGLCPGRSREMRDGAEE